MKKGPRNEVPFSLWTGGMANPYKPATVRRYSCIKEEPDWLRAIKSGSGLVFMDRPIPIQLLLSRAVSASVDDSNVDQLGGYGKIFLIRKHNWGG